MREVLEQGSARSRPRRMIPVITVATAAGISLAAIVAGLGWWAARPPTSDALAIIHASVIGTPSVTVSADPPLGALATPAGASLPGVRVRLSVGGDPGRPVTVEASPLQAKLYVEGAWPVTIPAGAFADIDVTIAPVDCASTSGQTAPAPSLDVLQTDTGIAVPMSDEARAAVLDAVEAACAGSGPAPQLTVTGARRGGEPPLETIGLVVDVDAVAERLVLTPLDTPGLRGLGAADRSTGEGIPLLWLISPGTGADEALTAYTQVYAVRDGTAYPWTIGIRITDDLPAMTPLTPSIR